MHFRLRPWQVLLLIACAIAALTYGIRSLRYRFVRSNPDLVRLLPHRPATTFFVDVDMLRRAGVLALVSAARVQDPEYTAFVRDTSFDYTRDLNAAAGSVGERDSYFAVRGRFDWERVTEYIRKRGGQCDDYCRIATSTPGKVASIRRVQPDVLAIAVSAGSDAVTEFKTGSARQLQAPVWVRLDAHALDNAAKWPPPARLLAESLRSATQITFSADRAQSGEMQLRMDAQFANERVAESVRNQLELQTKMLNLELTREHVKSNAADLTGLLSAGNFQLVDNDVVGSWPIHNELLQSLQVQ